MTKYKFNLSEIFEIAEQIERNGAVFYRKAAIKFNDNPEANSILLDLAIQEEQHEKTFSDILHNTLKNNDISQEDELTRQYLDAIAGQFVFDNSKIESELTDKMSQQDIFDAAIQKEKDSIIFFLGLKNALSSEQDKKTIDFIIEEEQRHLIILREYSEILKYKQEIY